MRCARTRAAVLGIALATLHAGCQVTCPSADRAPVPDGRVAAFAVLARDETRTQISLLDARGALITFPSPDDVDGPETDVWLDANDTWAGMLTPDGIGLEPQLAETPLPASLGGPFVTLFLPGDAREIARFPVDGSAPIETLTVPALRGDQTARGGVVRDLVVSSEADRPTVLYALRGEGVIPGSPDRAFGEDLLVIDPALDPEIGGAVIATIPLGAAGSSGVGGPDVPAAPQRMVAAFDRLYVGLDRYAASGLTSIVGPGAIAIVDPAGRRLVGTFELPFPDFTRCGQIARSPTDSGDPNVIFLVVACRGAGDDLASQQRSAGVVLLRVEQDPDVPEREPVVTAETWWRANTELDLVPSRGLVALPGNAIAAVSDGDASMLRDDTLFVLDLDAEPPVVQRIARGVLVPDQLSGLGTGAFLPDPAAPDAGLLVWPAGRSGILRMSVRSVGGSIEVEGLSRFELCNDLVAQQVRLLSQP
ncbi:MAG: hypothetical protein M3Y87_25230 [Myxococcota bacterium]|nr:hypothetical protein [Myxococcota bacterium]